MSGDSRSRPAISAVCTPMPVRFPTRGRPSMRSRTASECSDARKYFQRLLRRHLPPELPRPPPSAFDELVAQDLVAEQAAELFFELAGVAGLEVERRVAADLGQRR